jgi:hypothetical protein
LDTLPKLVESGFDYLVNPLFFLSLLRHDLFNPSEKNPMIDLIPIFNYTG